MKIELPYRPDDPIVEQIKNLIWSRMIQDSRTHDGAKPGRRARCQPAAERSCSDTEQKAAKQRPAREKSRSTPELTADVVQKLCEACPDGVSISEVEEALAERGVRKKRTTLRTELKGMVETGLVRMTGSRRGTRYVWVQEDLDR